MKRYEFSVCLGTPVVHGNLLICSAPSLRSEFIRIWPPWTWIPVGGITFVSNVCTLGDVVTSEPDWLCCAPVYELWDGWEQPETFQDRGSKIREALPIYAWCIAYAVSFDFLSKLFLYFLALGISLGNWRLYQVLGLVKFQNRLFDSPDTFPVDREKISWAIVDFLGRPRRER